MTKIKSVGAFVTMVAAVFCAFAAKANTEVDWSDVSGGVEGGIYTVPADTTVKVNTSADFDAVNALTKVIFANSNSVMRFFTTTPPTVKFQGPGSAAFAVAPVVTTTWTLGRSVEAGKESDFTRLVFERGISNATPATARYIVLSTPYTTNTIIEIDGPLGTNINFETSGYGVWNGRFDLGENFDLDGVRRTYFGYNSASSFSVIRQRGGTMASHENSCYLSHVTGVAAYFLEGGKYVGSKDYMYISGSYAHFRQTGGEFTVSRFGTSSPDASAVRRDFVFGGNGKSSITGRTSVFGEYCFVFNDSVEFRGRSSTDYFAWNMYWATNSIWAYNGGIADYVFWHTFHPGTGDNYSAPTNAFYAFDGGVRGVSGGNYRQAFGFTPKVRVYERGGCIMATRSGTFTLNNAILDVPTGNVLKSIALSDEARNRVWQAPPSVHITDATGDHAAAVVDYDFDTGKITNITVQCKGENYTAPTANLRYRQGERLLEEDLVCTVGAEAAPQAFTFSSETNCGANITIGSAFTNNLACAMVVDMDPEDSADHGKKTSTCNRLGLSYSGAYYAPYFPNCTNIILKSGELNASQSSGSGFRHDRMLPKCYRIELYGGHLVGGTARFSDIVLGGEVWLHSHNNVSSTTFTYIADLQTTHDDNSTTVGCLTIDAARGTNGTCTSVLKYGKVNFIKTASANSTITVKNWKSIPASRSFKVLLDLSETEVNLNTNYSRGVPDIVYPEGSEGELLMKWEMNPSDATRPYRLMARRIANGTMLIFR